VEDGAYVLRSCYRDFPNGTVHLAVVDPGVGSARRPLVVKSSRYFFVAPDNGLLTYIFDEESEVEIREITDKRYRLESEGQTFDGRDLFAPVAAWLTKGQPISSFGPIIDDPVKQMIVEPLWRNGVLVGQIEYVDRFGNLISNLTSKHIRGFQSMAENRRRTIRIGGLVIEGLVPSYSDGAEHSPCALMNSNGNLEVFLKNNNAAQSLCIGVGAEILLS